jgi:hypothetical protein
MLWKSAAIKESARIRKRRRHARRGSAEQRELDNNFPTQLAGRASDPDVAAVIVSETRQFEVRVNGRAGQKVSRILWGRLF